ncbi:MAG: stage III sporulation protein AE [Epulopiscium sp.]|nr:stage III sporulation protein AE [Candidatus Epulonipiscium sp.]
MKKIQKIVIVLFLWLVMPQKVYGEPLDNIWTNQLDTMDFSSINQTVTHIKSQTDNPYLREFNFKETMTKAIKGQLDLSITGIFKGILNVLFYEIRGFSGLIGKLLVISMLCALLSNLGESFQSKSTSQVGFYTCYIVLIIILLQSFQIAIEVASRTVESMVLIMQSVLPMLLTLMITSGAVASGRIFEPIVVFSVQIIAMFIKSILLPIIFLTAILAIVNSLSDKGVLRKMIELLNQITDWTLKGISLLFVGIMGFHGLTAPILDGVMNRAAKSAVGVVPVVGEALSGAVDIVMNCSLLIKNAIGAGAIVLLCIYCFIPIIKMLAFLFVYKLLAALIEPISDKRIINCISDMGDSATRLFGVLVTVSFLFIVTITILVGIGSMAAMMR